MNHRSDIGVDQFLKTVASHEVNAVVQGAFVGANRSWCWTESVSRLGSSALAPSHCPTMPPIDRPHQLVFLTSKGVEHRDHVALPKRSIE